MGRIAEQVKSYSLKNGYNYHSFIQCAFTEYSYSQFFNGCPFNNPETINKISELNPKIIIYGAITCLCKWYMYEYILLKKIVVGII